jgi:molybdopterin converting factor small subunit
MPSILVQFHGLWGLYLGTEPISLDSFALEDALEQTEARFGPLLRQRLKEHGARMDGGIARHSYITLNSTGLAQLKDGKIREGDVLHIFPAVTGG